MLSKEALEDKQQQMWRRQFRQSKGGETPQFAATATLQGRRISKTMRLKRIRQMIAQGIPYSVVASFAGIPENRIPRIVEEIKQLDKTELPSKLAWRDELRRKAESGRLKKWERNQLAWLEKPENLELPDKRKADAARSKEYRKKYKKCTGCGREVAIGENCQWHDCATRKDVIVI